MYGLLSGVTVLDLTTIVLGPYATRFLGDFGANVIKVEPPAGDLLRSVMPGRTPRMGAAYLNTNRNKKSVVLDLKSKDGKAAFRELVSGANAVAHNMRPKAAEKLGLGFETLRRINPRIVCCVAPGFGRGGEYAEEPAYDDVIQAASGIAQLNANVDGEPRFLPTIVCDKVGGLHLALAMLAGIARQARTGRGCLIEVPMFESIVSFLMVEHLGGLTFVPPLGPTGYGGLHSPYRRPYRTKDGFICVIPYTGEHWARFLKFIGRHDMASAEWLQDPVQRSENVGKLYEIVAEVIPTRSSAEWLAGLKKIDIPCTPVNRVEDLLEDSHLKDVEFFSETEHPSEGRVVSVRSPFKVFGVDDAPDLHAPELGEHTDKIVGPSSR